MIYAIFGDIHASYEALSLVLVDCKKRGANRIVCLGDIVGLGADPEKCVKLVEKHCHYTIEGNHDDYFMHNVSPLALRDAPTVNSDRWTKAHWFDPREFRELKDQLINEPFNNLREKVEYDLKHEPPKNKEDIEKYSHLFNLADQERYFDFLENLKPELPTDREVYIVTYNQWKEKEKKGRNKKRFAIAEEMIRLLPEGTSLFVGHSHMSFKVENKEENKRIINPGADARNPGNDISRYALYDTKNPNNTRIIGVKYDRKLTDAKIKGLGVRDN